MARPTFQMSSIEYTVVLIISENNSRASAYCARSNNLLNCSLALYTAAFRSIGAVLMAYTFGCEILDGRGTTLGRFIFAIVSTVFDETERE